jgi:hypothetical protein
MTIDKQGFCQVWKKKLFVRSHKESKSEPPSHNCGRSRQGRDSPWSRQIGLGSSLGLARQYSRQPLRGSHDMKNTTGQRKKRAVNILHFAIPYSTRWQYTGQPIPMNFKYEANEDITIYGKMAAPGSTTTRGSSWSPPDFILYLFVTVTCLLRRRIYQYTTTPRQNSSSRLTLVTDVGCSRPFYLPLLRCMFHFSRSSPPSTTLQLVISPLQKKGKSSRRC